MLAGHRQVTTVNSDSTLYGVCPGEASWSGGCTRGTCACTEIIDVSFNVRAHECRRCDTVPPNCAKHPNEMVFYPGLPRGTQGHCRNGRS